MDRDTLRNLVLSAGVFLLVLAMLPRLLPKPPPGTASENAQSTPATTGVVEDGTGKAKPVPTLETNKEVPTGGYSVGEAPSEVLMYMGSDINAAAGRRPAESPYRMRLAVSNVGASVESAWATDHAELLKSDDRYAILAPAEAATGEVYRSLAVEKINIDGVDLYIRDKKWQGNEVSESETGQAVSFHLDIYRDAAPALRLTRTFKLPKQDRKSGRHDVESTLVVQNLTDQPHQILITFWGGLHVAVTNPRFDDRYVDWGVFDGSHVVGSRKSASSLHRQPDQPLTLFEPDPAAPQRRLSWAATANTYFTCIVAPQGRGASEQAAYVAGLMGIDADGDAFTTDDATVRFVTRREELAQGAALEFPASLYIGEKDGDAFRRVPEYRERNYYFQVSAGYGWCTFAWLVELMILLLNGLEFLVRDYGVAIMILVLIVRTLLHPITKKGQVNMVRMQQRMGELAPKIEEVKRKFGNDKVRLQQETMKIYREQGINPASNLLTCLPMFLQMPIWVALYISLSNNIRMRHEPAFWGWTWIHDLAAQDAVFTFPTALTVPLLGWKIASFNLLPILVGVFMYLQQKMQPKPAPNPNASDQQRQQQQMMQKMMPMMSIMMLLIFYKMPSGLNLYIFSSSFFGMIEQHRIRKHIKEREAAGTLHKAAAKPEEASRRKRPGEMSFFEKLQKMAEDARTAKPKRSEKKRSKDKSRR